MTPTRLLIVLVMVALTGLSGCQIRFKASEVEIQGGVRNATYDFDGLAFYNPFKPTDEKSNLALGE